VWQAAGHALFNIATPEAMTALLSSMEDHDWFGRHMAIKAAFARGSSAASPSKRERSTDLSC
jgi:HEAT repeat protein